MEEIHSGPSRAIVRTFDAAPGVILDVLRARRAWDRAKVVDCDHLLAWFRGSPRDVGRALETLVSGGLLEWCHGPASVAAQRIMNRLDDLILANWPALDALGVAAEAGSDEQRAWTHLVYKLVSEPWWNETEPWTWDVAEEIDLRRSEVEIPDDEAPKGLSIERLRKTGPWLPVVGAREIDLLFEVSMEDAPRSHAGYSVQDILRFFGLPDTYVDQIKWIVDDLCQDGMVELADDKGPRYRAVGDRARRRAGPAQGYLFLARRQDGKPFAAGDLTAAMDWAPSTTTENLAKLCEAGLVREVSHGIYEPTEADPHRTICATVTEIRLRRGSSSVAALLETLNEPRADNHLRRLGERNLLVLVEDAIHHGLLSQGEELGRSLRRDDRLELTDWALFRLGRCQKCRIEWGARDLVLEPPAESGRAPGVRHASCPTEAEWDSDWRLWLAYDAYRYSSEWRSCGSCRGYLHKPPTVSWNDLVDSRILNFGDDAVTTVVAVLHRLAAASASFGAATDDDMAIDDALQLLRGGEGTGAQKRRAVELLLAFVETANLARRDEVEAWSRAVVAVAEMLDAPREETVLHRPHLVPRAHLAGDGNHAVHLADKVHQAAAALQSRREESAEVTWHAGAFHHSACLQPRS